ncbi:matrixin family metalloprotease [Clostridium hydrogeniformans]|uniref:matrixin family metalloprotease n=1 Tax=Clostridium hydrogeniformans TaxID=349933 RepID=UPI000483F61F|nr:matrixin family metalloprotease [Clostridium hydrogeniformans]
MISNLLSKKLKKYIAITFIVFISSLSLFNVKAFAVGEPTWNYTWGFAKGYSLAVKSRYWQYGTMDWTSAISATQSEYSASPANASIRVSSSNNYNDCKIRLKSAEWTQYSWWGITDEATDVSGAYTVDLNSYTVSKSFSSSSLEWYKKKITVHEVGHAFGFNHATSPDYVMCQGYINVNYLTSYENQMLVDRYGRYN